MRYLACFTLLLALAGAHAAEPALPSLPLADSEGKPADLARLSTGTRWVLLVVDPAAAQTQAALARLQRADVAAGRLVVVAVGSPAAFRSLASHYGKTSSTRFYREANGALLKALQLPGLPVALGIEPDNRIAWQLTGASRQLDMPGNLPDSWLGVAAQELP
jgi:hypothetical protein